MNPIGYNSTDIEVTIEGQALMIGNCTLKKHVVFVWTEHISTDLYVKDVAKL